jgi:7-alpha-hydroxysteroid dehydrogenase
MILDRFRLDGRAAIVTGASRGIGAACALAFAQAGADVVLTARNEQKLREVASAVEGLGRRAVVVAADLDDTSNMPVLVEQALSVLGRLDAVVNNVGGTVPRPALDTSEGYLERAFHFNVTTAFALTKAAAPRMLEAGGGVIVNISSSMGRLRDRGYLAYGTAKAALEHMTHLLAHDLAPRIRVNAVAPGATETEALGTVLNEELREAMVRGTPLRRLGTVEDIAAAALFLASDASSYITGRVLAVDGGIESPNLSLGFPDL